MRFRRGVPPAPALPAGHGRSRGSRAVRFTLALITAVVLWDWGSGAAGADAQGKWVLTATDLSAPDGNAAQARLAIGPDGTAIAIWRRTDGGDFLVQAAIRPPGGSFGTPVDLAAPGGAIENLAVTIAGDGTATAIWSQNGGSHWIVRAVIRPPGGSFSAPVNVSTPGQDAYWSSVGAAPDGTTTVIWVGDNGSDEIVQAATRPPGGSFQAPVNVSAASDYAYGPELAAAADGTMTAVWSQTHEGDNIIRAATRPPGGSFGAPVDLSASGKECWNPQVAVAPNGRATVVWEYPDTPDGGGLNWIIQAATRPAGGGFGEPVDLSAPGQDAAGPQVAVARDGTPVVVWYRLTGGYQTVQASIRAPGGFGAPVNLSASGQHTGSPQIAIDPGGIATAIWHRYVGANGVVQTASTGSSIQTGCGKATLKPGKFKRIRRNGTGRLTVKAGTAGRVALKGTRQVRKHARTLRKAGKTTLKVRAKGKALRKLKRRGRVRVKLTVRFRPANSACKAKVKTRKVTLAS